MFKAGDTFVAVDSELSRTESITWHDIHVGIVKLAMPYSGIYYVYFPKSGETERYNIIKRLVADDLIYGKCADAYLDWCKRAEVKVEYTINWHITF